MNEPTTASIIMAFVIYFLPSIIAVIRKHHNKVSLILTNTLLGWTGIMWLVTFIWAFSKPKPVAGQQPINVTITNTNGN